MLSIVIILVQKFSKYSENFVKEAAIDICLVTKLFGRVLYFRDFIEKVNVVHLIEVLLQLVHFTIGFLIYFNFLEAISIFPRFSFFKRII